MSAMNNLRDFLVSNNLEAKDFMINGRDGEGVFEGRPGFL